MGDTRSVSFRVDLELYSRLSDYAEQNGLSTSQAAREVLRQALGWADPVDRGWREGFSAAYHETMRELAASPPPHLRGGAPADDPDWDEPDEPGW